MALTGLLFASMIPLLKSTAEIISKEKVDDDTLHVFTVSLFTRVAGIPLILAGLLFVGMPAIEPKFYTVIAITVPIGISGTLLYIKALEVSDLSVVSPLSSISPVFVILTGIVFLGETPGVFGLVGIITIIIGVYILNVTRSTSNSLIQPFKRVHKDPGTKYIVIMMLIYSISAPLDKIGVTASSPLFYTFSLYSGMSIALFGVMAWRVSGWQSDCKQHYKTLVPIGIFNSVSSVVQMYAITLTFVIYVLSIKRMGILISVLYGVVVKNEGLGRARITGSIIILIGVTLISISIL